MEAKTETAAKAETAIFQKSQGRAWVKASSEIMTELGIDTEKDFSSSVARLAPDQGGVVDFLVKIIARKKSIREAKIQLEEIAERDTSSYRRTRSYTHDVLEDISF